jgi:signal transduction histidine kinase
VQQGFIVNRRNLSDLYEVAARATINERCATAYLHDIRGSMQALFSAMELLGRSARKGGSNLERVEKACALARRAIDFHEKSTLDVLQMLTLQDVESAKVDVGALMNDVVHFLRNEAANKEVVVSLHGTAAFSIAAERARLQTLLVGLVADAIDATPAGTELPITVGNEDGFVVISIESNAGYAVDDPTDDLPHELTLHFARQFLSNNGGRLEINSAMPPRGALRLYYPIKAE